MDDEGNDAVKTNSSVRQPQPRIRQQPIRPLESRPSDPQSPCKNRSSRSRRRRQGWQGSCPNAVNKTPNGANKNSSADQNLRSCCPSRCRSCCADEAYSIPITSIQSTNQNPKEEKQVDTREAFDAVCHRYAEKYNGKYVPKKVRYYNHYPFKCCLKHTINLSKEQIEAGKWCEKCQKLHTQLKKISKKNRMTILDSTISANIRVRCQAGHEFTIQAKKYFYYLTKRGQTKIHCAECKNNQLRFSAFSQAPKSTQHVRTQQLTSLTDVLDAMCDEETPQRSKRVQDARMQLREKRPVQVMPVNNSRDGEGRSIRE